MFEYIPDLLLGGNASFAETHEIHYAGNVSATSPAYNFSTGATVHTAHYDNSAYRPGSRTPLNASLYGGGGVAGGPSLHSIPYGHHQPLQGSTSAVNRQELNNDEADSTPTGICS